MKRYNNYHKHDHISNIYTPDTNTKAEEYIKKCVEYRHTNYFTTNHGSIGDIFEAKTLCNKYGIRCIAGLEGYIVPDARQKDKSNYHIIIIPKTNVARKKLNKISSRANIEFYYYKPRILLEDLLSLDKDDVYITSACSAGIIRDDIATEKIFVPLVKHFGNNVYLEVQNHMEKHQISINKKCIELKERYGLGLIAANDSHYIDENGKQERLELLKGKGITYGDEDTYNLDFPDYDEMFNRFVKQGVLTNEQIKEAMDNTLIFDSCEEIDINDDIKMPTIYPELNLKERVNLLKKIINEKFSVIKKEENITGEKFKKYRDGIRYEMKVIEETNEVCHTVDYFLLNTKLVDLATNKYGGVLTRTGRGSCGSFYINRILGMTQLDRFNINLPLYPDRFMSSARLIENRALPDVDFNVKEQEPFVKASKELLGENMCYPMIAYGTMQLGEAFRNVCRSHGLSYDEYNGIAKNIENYSNDERWKPIIEEANKYVGTIISASVHPCAHVLSNNDLTEEYGVVRIGENICVMITSSEADQWKVLKNDYLIVKVWKLISETFDMIGKPIIKFNDLLDSIKEDQRIWDLFKNGITCTLNQVDSDNGTAQAKKYGIDTFEGGAFIAAAIRPSFDSWREDFLNRKDYDTGSEILNNILSCTHGYIIFQENLMQYFEWLNISPAESIGLIKKISKKKIKPDDFKKLEDRLRKSWIEKTGKEDGFDHTWNLMQSCMAYSFAAPHAAATSGDMCYGAYLKVNYPLEYYAVALTNYSDDEVRTKKLTKELDYFNISLHPIKFRKSGANYTIDKENRALYKGISSLKFCNEKIADELYELGKNHYDSFIDLLKDMKNTSVDSRQLLILTKLDFFSEFGEPNALLKQIEQFNKIYGKKQFKKDKLKDLELSEDIVRKYATKETEKMFTGVDSLELLKENVQNYKYPKTTVIDKLKYEQECLGYVTVHDKSVSNKLFLVTKLDIKRSIVNVDIYSVNSGKTHHVRQWRRSYDGNPYSEGDLLYVYKIDKKYKRVPSGEYDVNGKQIWVEDPNELEYWLNSYTIQGGE